MSPTASDSSNPAQTPDGARFRITYSDRIDGTNKVGRAGRETVESIAVAIILALLFRSFVAEAFVIPTGSMAPTLQGRHLDLECPQCKYRYRTGASSENPGQDGRITAGSCPLCRFEYDISQTKNRNERSFSGDRILVSKFAYALGEPERWEVIVFKFPGNAKQNYIKRLVGLPGEELMISDGDIFVRRSPNDEFKIVRKPPKRQLAMMQLVDDSDYTPEAFERLGMPGKWQPWTPADDNDPSVLLTWPKARTMFDGQNSDDRFIRYRHYVLNHDAWSVMEQFPVEEANVEPGKVSGFLTYLQQAMDEPVEQLITDYYAYNDSRDKHHRSSRSRPREAQWEFPHWVGDLAIEGHVTLEDDEGELLLKAVEGGFDFNCRIDVATGLAQLSIYDQESKTTVQDAWGDDNQPLATAETPIRGAGDYWFRFSNVDDQVRLWVNDKLIEFDRETTYHLGGERTPYLSPLGSDLEHAADPGDMGPLGIGSNGLKMEIHRLRVFRDVYYIADSPPSSGSQRDDYNFKHARGPSVTRGSRLRALRDPSKWANDPLFRYRRPVTFEIPDECYFPMGDNSPQSADARSWNKTQSGRPNIPNYVERRLLIGRALVVYWPHGWRLPIIENRKFSLPLIPNFERMGYIR